MSDEWIKAASRYASRNTESGLVPEQVPAVSQIAREMMRFYRSSEGCDAALLLELAGTVISFGQMEGLGGPFGEPAFLCWSHLGPSTISHGRSMLPRRRPVPTSFLNLAKAAVRNGLTPEEFPKWFQGELDKIAAEAPAVLQAGET